MTNHLKKLDTCEFIDYNNKIVNDRGVLNEKN